MLYLIPNVLHESQDPRCIFPEALAEMVCTLDGVICESEKKARAFFKHFTLKVPLQQFPLVLLNEHTKELESLLQPLLRGERWGLISDAGVPCIADPGADLVHLAHKHSIAVEAFFGPCSILLALQLSGMSGQRFRFHGYLPREKLARQETLRALEKAAVTAQETQIFIEAPYRNMELIADCLTVLQPATEFCVAWDIGSPTQGLKVKKVSEWKRGNAPDIHKKPALFLVGKAN